MSARSRAVPWFLERPPYYRSSIGIVSSTGTLLAMHTAFSFDHCTWFGSDGRLTKPGFYLPWMRPPPDVLRRHPVLVGFFDEWERKAREAGDKFLGEAIASAGARA